MTEGAKPAIVGNPPAVPLPPVATEAVPPNAPAAEPPLVFISHKSSDLKLALQLREWMQARAGGKLRYFLSADGIPEGSPRTLSDKARARAAEASVMLVICTSVEHDWSYVLLEMGVALDPANPRTTVVALDCGYTLAGLQDVTYVKGYDLPSLKAFCRDFLTTTYFPTEDGIVLSVDTSDAYVEGAAKELAAATWKHLPQDPSLDFTVEPLPMLKLVIPLDCITEPVPDGSSPARQLLATADLPAAIEKGAHVSGSQITGYELFKLTAFPDMPFSELVGRSEDRAWVDRLVDDVVRGLNKTVNLNRPPYITGTSGAEYYPALVRLSRQGGRGSVVCEVCFVRAWGSEGEPGRLGTGM